MLFSLCQQFNFGYRRLNLREVYFFGELRARFVWPFPVVLLITVLVSSGVFKS